MYTIFNMCKEQIPELIEMWGNQYAIYCNETFIPNFLNGGKSTMIQYLENQISQDNAIVVKKEEKIVGYFAWMYFDFHKEPSAFCPIIGHATIIEDRYAIYHFMYTYVAQKWVEDCKFNHLWMVFNEDNTLKDTLYDIGFGSHVMDAYLKVQKPINPSFPCEYRIARASYAEAEVLADLLKESLKYYLQSPIFLKRNSYELDDIKEIIKIDDLFVAWDNNTPIGCMNLTVHKSYNIENLTSVNTGSISKIGAYIKPQYRGLGIGKALLNEVKHACVEKNVSYLHVCYETANSFANQFWQKHFKPTIRSLRRTINKDMDGCSSFKS